MLRQTLEKNYPLEFVLAVNIEHRFSSKILYNLASKRFRVITKLEDSFSIKQNLGILTSKGTIRCTRSKGHVIIAINRIVCIHIALNEGSFKIIYDSIKSFKGKCRTHKFSLTLELKYKKKTFKSAKKESTLPETFQMKAYSKFPYSHIEL